MSFIHKDKEYGIEKCKEVKKYYLIAKQKTFETEGGRNEGK